MEKTNQHPLSDAELLELKRWSTPTIYNGWEQITKLDAGKDGFNIRVVVSIAWQWRERNTGLRKTIDRKKQVLP